MAYKMVGKKRVWVDDEVPQKSIQAAPVASGLLAQAPAAPAGQTWQDFASGYGDAVGIGSLSGVHNSKLFDTMANQIAKQIGFTGPISVPGSYQFENFNESGSFMDTAQGKQASPEFLKALEQYRFAQSPTEAYKGAITDTAGNSVGTFTTGNKDTSFDKFANTAIPLALAALGGAAFGGYIPGAEIGAGSAGGAAGGAAAADIGALGLAEGVYGAGGALGAGVAPGTVGGLAGSTAGFGGLGSVLPAGVGFGGAAAAGAAGLLEPELSQAFSFDPSAAQSANPLGGGLAPTVETLPTLGAETTAFGSVPELSAMAAGAPVQTAFGSFALPAASTLPTAAPGLLDTVKGAGSTASQWMKDNPLLGRLLTSGAVSLLAGSGGNSSGGSQSSAPSGPPVQWNSPLQQGLLAPVQQYAPAAITQNKPAGLLAQGFENDGAWRYLKG